MTLVCGWYVSRNQRQICRQCYCASIFSGCVGLFGIYVWHFPSLWTMCFSKQGANFLESVTHLCVFSGCIGLPCRYARLVCGYIGLFCRHVRIFGCLWMIRFSKPAANLLSMSFYKCLLRMCRAVWQIYMTFSLFVDNVFLETRGQLFWVRDSPVCLYCVFCWCVGLFGRYVWYFPSLRIMWFSR